MWNARRVLGDATVVGERRNGGRVFALWRAQPQPRGCQHGSRENRGAWQPFHERHRGLLSSDHVLWNWLPLGMRPEKRRGEPASRLPSWNPLGFRRID